MNKLEKVIYDLVADNPVLKHKIVDLYQSILGFIPQKKIKTSLPIIERKGFFYGFHDKSPFSKNGQFLLAHHNLIGNKTVQAGDKAEIGFFKGNNWQEFQKLGETQGWNWQLGPMLQWFGDSNEKIIFNTLKNNQQIAIIKDLKGEGIEELDFPIVHISSDQQYASSYNFFRVEKVMKGYGMVSDSPTLHNNETDFFKILSLKNNQISFEISLAEIMKINPHLSMDGAFHFFHHSLFNPNSKRIFFLHRWLDKNDRRWTRMFSVGVDGADLYLFPMDEMVSHITWASDTEIFAYLRYPNQGDGYYLIEDKTGKEKRYFTDVFNPDGHPTMDKKRGFVLTDTYPDRFRNQFLALAMMSDGKRIDLCRTHLPKLFKRELQVDLHPRLHPRLPIACFDSGHSGIRSLNTLNFSQVL